jgi:hypothetical protein
VDWKKGKPVRVIRNYKLRKHSKYAPELGNRWELIFNKNIEYSFFLNSLNSFFIIINCFSIEI